MGHMVITDLMGCDYAMGHRRSTDLMMRLIMEITSSSSYGITDTMGMYWR